MIVRPGRVGFRSAAVGFGAAAVPLTLSLAHFDGSDGARTTTDEIVTVTHTLDDVFYGGGTSELDTAFKKFGTASVLVPAFGDCDRITGVSLDTSQNWTIECFFRFDSEGTISIWGTDSLDSEEWFRINITFVTSSELLGIIINDALYGSIMNAAGSPAPTVDTNWHHVAVVKEGTTYSAYYDGNRVATTTSASNMADIDTFYLYALSAGVTGHAFDEWRVSQTARYSGATYVVPTGAFTVD